jgi:MFS family permease
LHSEKQSISDNAGVGVETHVGIILSFFALGYISGSSIAAVLYTGDSQPQSQPHPDLDPGSESNPTSSASTTDMTATANTTSTYEKSHRSLALLKHIMLVFGLVQVSSAILMALVKSYWSLCLGRFMQGAATGAFWVLSLSYLAFFIRPNQMGRVTSLLLACNSYSGATIGGFMYERYGYQGPFFVLVVLGILDVCMRVAMPSVGMDMSREEFVDESQSQSESESLLSNREDEGTEKARLYSTLLTNAPFVIIILQESVMEVLTSSLETVLSVHLLTPPYELSVSSIGLVFLAAGMPEFLFGPLAGFIFDSFGFSWTSIPGLLLTLVPLSFLCIPSLPLPPLILCICFLTGLQCYANAAILPELSRVVPLKLQPKAYAAYNIVYSFGLWLGPFGSGGLYSKIGFVGYIWCYIILVGLMLVLSILKATRVYIVV